MTGSLLGGKWSDHVLRRCSESKGGKVDSEVCTFHLRNGGVYVIRILGPIKKHHTYDVRFAAVIDCVCLDGRKARKRCWNLRRSIFCRIFFYASNIFKHLSNYDLMLFLAGFILVLWLTLLMQMSDALLLP